MDLSEMTGGRAQVVEARPPASSPTFGRRGRIAKPGPVAQTVSPTMRRVLMASA